MAQNYIIDILKQHGTITHDVLVIKHNNFYHHYRVNYPDYFQEMKYIDIKGITINSVKIRSLSGLLDDDYCKMCGYECDVEREHHIIKSNQGWTYNICNICLELLSNNLFDSIKYPLMLTQRLVSDNIIDLDCRNCIINVLKLSPLNV